MAASDRDGFQKEYDDVKSLADGFGSELSRHLKDLVDKSGAYLSFPLRIA